MLKQKVMDTTKSEAYYESLDKRTREYKQYKAWAAKQSKGLGDTVEKALTAVGITKSKLEDLGFEDCGCDERKERLNKLFRYKRPECLTESEFLYLSAWFDKNKNRVTAEEQKRLLNIYNRVFNERRQPTSCGSCLREVSTRLKTLMEGHKNG